MKQAVILAGGKGTRLASVIGELPKPLVDVGGEPLLAHHFRLLKRYGFTSVVLLVSHAADAIRNWCNSLPPDLQLDVTMVDDGTPRGTAGAVLSVLPKLEAEFLVLYGDTMLDIDLERFALWHKAQPGADASLLLHPNDHPQDSDLVEIDHDGRILGLHPYPHQAGAWLPNLVNAALYVVRRDSLLPWRDAQQPLDFGKNLFPAMLNAGAKLFGYVSPEYIKDAGTPARLERVRRDFADGVIARASLYHTQRGILIDRDGTLNDARDYVRSAAEFHLVAGADVAMRRLNDNGWRTAVVTNQPVLARGEVSEQDLRLIHARLDTELASSSAFVDRLYYCPHHPDKGFSGEIAALKIQCDCRKPAPGLLLRAASELNLDLRQSWMIGDSTADLGAADAAGVTAITVETGEGGLDERYPYEPGIVVPDFAAAVDFVLDDYPSLVEGFTALLPRISASEDWFVGGLSRSGKSTTAAILQRELRLRNVSCEIIQLDRWILDHDRRGADVFERYDMAAIERILATLSERTARSIAVELPAYSRKTRRRLPQTLRRSVAPGMTIIWEGVVAVELARRTNNLARSLHMETDETYRRDRVARYYCRRGEGAKAADLIATREIDEHAPLRAIGALATYRLSLDGMIGRKAKHEIKA